MAVVLLSQGLGAEFQNPAVVGVSPVPLVAGSGRMLVVAVTFFSVGSPTPVQVVPAVSYGGVAMSPFVRSDAGLSFITLTPTGGVVRVGL